MNAGQRPGYQNNEGVIALTAQTERLGIAALIAGQLAAAWEACGAFEWIALGYLGLSSALIALFAENLAHPLRLIGMQALVGATILVLCRAGVTSAEHPAQIGETISSKFWRFWRHWYPHLFFLFCFEELSRLVHLVNPGWEDAKLIAFDRWLSSVNPSLWLERFAHPALTEFMEFSYFTYFLYLLILGGILYCQRDFKNYWAVMTYSAVGYGFGYVIAMLFPVQSPWFTFAGMWHGDLIGGPFTALINFIEKCGRVHGAAFPSQHVAGAIAALWGAWRHRRWLFWVFLPFVACMCVSTVYVRNHYVADVFGGMVTGTLGYVMGTWVVAYGRMPQRNVCTSSLISSRIREPRGLRREKTGRTMRCEPGKTNQRRRATVASSQNYSAKRRFAALSATLAAAGLGVLAAACGSGGNGSGNPPPPAANEIFIVDNFSGDVSAFSVASGKLALIPGSSAMFSSPITLFAVEPSGNFLAAVTATSGLVSTLQIANIGAGGKITLAPLTDGVNSPAGLAISSQGVIAVVNQLQQTVQLLMVQNNVLFAGGSAATGPLPQDAVFSSDGNRLYVGDSAAGTISVFAVSVQGAAIQAVQTAVIPVAAGEFAPNIVRVALSASGRKLAATTFDGKLFVGDVSAMDGTLSGFTEAHTNVNANLEEVVFDPSAQNVYTGDLDNGGILGFTINASGLTPLAGSPFSTGTLPGGPTGMAFNSAGDRLYVVMGAQSSIFTYSRNTNGGDLTATGDVVSTIGFLAGRIVRVPTH